MEKPAWCRQRKISFNREMADALKSSFIIYWEPQPFVSTLTAFISTELVNVMAVTQGQALAAALLSSTKQPYEPVAVGNDGPIFESTELVNSLSNVLTSDFHLAIRCLPYHQFDPYVQLLMDLTRAKNLNQVDHWPVEMSSAKGGRQNPFLATIWNQFVAEFRAQASDGAMERKRLTMVRSANKNAKSCKKYVLELFSLYKKLYVQRLDLSYFMHLDGGGHPAEVKSDIANLLRCRKLKPYARLFDGLIGYIWKLERVAMCWRVHLVLIFDGHRVHSPDQATLVCQLWKTRCAPIMRTGVNLRNIPDSYKCCAIGMIEKDDRAVRRQLDMLITYMAKTDAVMRLKAPSTSRFITYSRGEMPKRPKTNKRNRVELP